MKKIAILTEYYKSYNYGGVLQAYALCKVIENLGFHCEQIQYQKNKDKVVFSLNMLIKFLPNKLKSLIMKITYAKRTTSFDKFRNYKIKHSEGIYNDKDIINTVDDYDVFIVGSDQVWNPNLFNKSYFLEFVPENVSEK